MSKKFTEIATEQGWNESTQITMLRRFIEKQGDEGALNAWAGNVAAFEDNGGLDPAFPTDPAERKWLDELTPASIRDNAHRFYDYMNETGMWVESDLREAAFRKAATALDLDYDVLYDAWLNETPISV